jgi:hypothetical protein
MEKKRSFKGLKKYESLLKTICITDDYHWLKENEWEGCLGVACVISVIEGITPTLFALSNHLDVPHYNSNLQSAFERLRINGVFNSKQDIKNDPFLTGMGTDSKMRTAAESERAAWCHIAGVAGGFIGVGKNVEK